MTRNKKNNIRTQLARRIFPSDVVIVTPGETTILAKISVVENGSNVLSKGGGGLGGFIRIIAGFVATAFGSSITLMTGRVFVGRFHTKD